MSQGTGRGSAAAALLFVLLAAAAALAAWPKNDAGAWPDRERDLRELRETMLRDATLHLPLQPPDYPGSAAYCAECHPLPPHDGSGVAEILLNHHSHVMDCLVCHWSRSEGRTPGLVWSPTRGAADDGGIVRRRHVLKLDAPSGGTIDLPAVRGRVTSRQTCFDRGPQCTACHREGGMGRFVRPGNPARAAALEELPQILTLPPGARWYFPQRR